MSGNLNGTAAAIDKQAKHLAVLAKTLTFEFAKFAEDVKDFRRGGSMSQDLAEARKALAKAEEEVNVWESRLETAKPEEINGVRFKLSGATKERDKLSKQEKSLAASLGEIPPVSQEVEDVLNDLSLGVRQLAGRASRLTRVWVEFKQDHRLGYKKGDRSRIDSEMAAGLVRGGQAVLVEETNAGSLSK